GSAVREDCEERQAEGVSRFSARDVHDQCGPDQCRPAGILQAKQGSGDVSLTLAFAPGPSPIYARALRCTRRRHYFEWSFFDVPKRVHGIRPSCAWRPALVLGSCPKRSMNTQPWVEFADRLFD